MTIPPHFQKFAQDVRGAIEHMKHEFVTIRTSRANPAMLERVRVDAYGTQMPVGQLATISVIEARSLEIRPWDPTVAVNIEKAIQKADLGVTPMNDGTIIRLAFPSLTEESRREYIKVVKRLAEEAKVKIRRSRHDAQEETIQIPLKDKKITEDEKFKRQSQLDDLTAEFIKEVDALAATKEREISEI